MRRWVPAPPPIHSQFLPNTPAPVLCSRHVSIIHTAATARCESLLPILSAALSSLQEPAAEPEPPVVVKAAPTPEPVVKAAPAPEKKESKKKAPEPEPAAAEEVEDVDQEELMVRRCTHLMRAPSAHCSTPKWTGGLAGQRSAGGPAGPGSFRHFGLPTMLH